jgi:hypothetical protein
VAGTALPHAGFAGFTLVEFSLLNRTFVLPFLLIALNAYLRDRRLLAFAMFGVLYNLHVVSVNFALAMVLFDCLMRLRREGLRIPALGMVLFLIGAAPVLIWRFSSDQALGGANWDWFNLLANSYFYHLFYLIGPFSAVLMLTFGGLATIAIFFCARRATPPVRGDTVLRNFVIGALCVVLIQVIGAYLYPAAILVQAQIMRAGVFVMIFAYIAFAGYLAARFRAGMIQGSTFALLTAAMVFSVVPVVLLGAWGLLRWVSPPRLARVLAGALVTFGFVGTAGALYQAGIWRPDIAVYQEQTPWYEAQRWARENTPLDTVFITPPHRWWFYEPEWRVGAERSTVVTLSELLEIAFDPSYVPDWRARFSTLAPGAEQQLRGDVLENNAITARAFYSLSAEQLQAAGHRFGASYLVIEKPHSYPFPMVYQNEAFVIYRIPR